MSFDIKIERSPRGSFDIITKGQVSAIRHSVKDILDDIAVELQGQATRFAPESEEEDKLGGSARSIPSGSLKAHPVDIEKTAFGTVANFSREAEGHRTIIDPITKRFVKGKGSLGAGDIFYNISVSYPKRPFYARYVAGGTGIFGSRGSPIVSVTGKHMKFRYKGKNFKIRTILGQEANPYLEYASEEVNSYYIPTKMRQLRAEIDAIT